MKNNFFLPSFLAGLAVEERLNRLLSLYEEVTEDIETWKQRTPFRCPPGCGTCCSQFEPHISSVEAELIAAYLIGVKRELSSLVSDSPEAPGLSCLFYSPSYAGACSIYPVRPLICRLFGYSAVKDKSGTVVYRLCRHMPGTISGENGRPPRREFTEAELSEIYGFCPPVMQNYSTLLESDNRNEKKPLHLEVAGAYRALLLAARLAGRIIYDNPEPDGGNGPGNAPLELPPKKRA